MHADWLDLVCKEWEAVLSSDAHGEVRGAWVLHTGRSYGLPFIKLPPITPFTGIWMEIPEDLSVRKSMTLRHEILNDLIDQLPPADIIETKLHWSLQDWLPFYWKGFRQETRYTFRFPVVDPEAIESQFSKSFRRNLRTAERHYTVEEGTARELHPLLDWVFDSRDTTFPMTQPQLEHVTRTMAARGQGRIFVARDMDGIQAAIWVVWDATTMYYLLGGRSRTDSKQGTNLLLWHAIGEAGARGLAFDFEGSMIEGVNQFFQSFGADLVPYLYLYRYRGLAKLKALR